jgi:small subunit ribosomal protein S10
VESLKRTGCKVSGPIPLPTKRTLYPVLRSTFVNKKSFEHFEVRIHKRLIEIKEPTKETAEALVNIKVPAGVDVEIKT